jgi:hypothetical protein
VAGSHSHRSLINGLEIDLTRFVKSPLPLFAKEGESLPLEKGGQEGFSESVLINMSPLISTCIFFKSPQPPFSKGAKEHLVADRKPL